VRIFHYATHDRHKVITVTPPINVLFICTANACRSQMAEAILRQVGDDRFIARSAGVSPIGAIHPLASIALADAGIRLDDQYSKGLDEVMDIEHDLIITLCDSAACLVPQTWPGQPVTVHWGLSDPVSCLGSEQERIDMATETVATLRKRIERLVVLPLEKLTADQIYLELARISET